MQWEAWFAVANTLALIAWVALILLPRRPWLHAALQVGVAGLLSIAYAALVAVYFFGVESGGYSSLAAVRALFGSDPVVLAGWLHYLAFDLLIGLVIAERLDAAVVSRWLQAPILVSTFMFGPVGYLLYLGTALALGRPPALAERSP